MTRSAPAAATLMACLQAPPPSLLRRLGAMVYDAFLLTGLLFFATTLLLPLRGGEAFRPNELAYSAYLLGVCFMFYGWFWTHGGQTLGMRAWKIRLCVEDGSAVTWGRAAVRFAAALLSLGLFGLGYWWALWDKRKRCWHDLLSGTHLVWQNERLSAAWRWRSRRRRTPARWERRRRESGSCHK